MSASKCGKAPDSDPDPNYKEVSVKVCDVDEEVEKLKPEWELETKLDDSRSGDPARTVVLAFRRKPGGSS